MTPRAKNSLTPPRNWSRSSRRRLQKSRMRSVRKEFLARHSELKPLQTQWTAITKAKSALETTPDDEMANGTYGRYLCLLAGH